jgi:hypothetical protein
MLSSDESPFLLCKWSSFYTIYESLVESEYTNVPLIAPDAASRRPFMLLFSSSVSFVYLISEQSAGPFTYQGAEHCLHILFI